MDRPTKNKLKNLHLHTPELGIQNLEKWGIHYNSNRVLPFIHFNQFDKYADLLTRDLIPGGRTMLILASGTENELIERYQYLDYENVILVDYMFNNYECIDKYPGKKIICINLDAYVCIQVLLQLKDFEVNTVVSLNVGVQGGGANMCIATNALGLLFPIMSNEVVIITSLDYYKRSQIYKYKKSNWLNLPFETKKVLRPTESDNTDPDIERYYIDPNLFTTYKFMENIGGEVVLLKNKVHKVHSFHRGRLNVGISHTSIFNIDLTDDKTLGVMKFENHYQEAIFRNKFPNLVSWNGSYFRNKRFNKEVVEKKTYDLSDLFQFNVLLNDFGIKTLIFTPVGGDYLELIDRISEMDNGVNTVIFTHLNHGDYEKTLYNYNK